MSEYFSLSDKLRLVINGTAIQNAFAACVQLGFFEILASRDFSDNEIIPELSNALSISEHGACTGSAGNGVWVRFAA